MPAFVPDAATLLEAAANDLERDVLPALAGFPRFRTRVIVNVLRLLRREAELGASADAAELARLRTMLGEPGGGLPDLRAVLAGRIDDGAIPLDSPQLVDHLVATLGDALAIDNPNWTHPRG